MFDKKTDKTFTVKNNDTGESWEFPVYDGTMGPSVVDFGKFYSKTGHFSFDPGYTSTASCESSITFIDGEKGQLLYRGYPIEQLAEKADYMEVCYLLLNGELPSKVEHEQFSSEVTKSRMLNEQIKNMFQAFPRKSHPMAIMAGVCAALAAFYHDVGDIRDPEYRHKAIISLIAKMPTIAAMAYKYANGNAYMYPKFEYDHAQNFIYMLFANPCEEYELDPVLTSAMDLILTLHADHEQNASTSTVRLAGSSAANPFGCIAAGVAALWGPAHGGANEAVLNMLDGIGSFDNVQKFLKQVKDPDDSTRLMGFGHRVYKNYDPRAKIMRKTCHEVLDALDKHDDPKLKLAMELERIALEDDYFVERKLYPNVDFYSGIIFEAMGIPRNTFTVIFAVARSIGWIAQWNEMIESGDSRIGRPRQLFLGAKQRDFVPLSER